MPDLKIKRAPPVESNNRAWLQVYDDINDIVNAVNNKSGTESRTKGTLGNDGDIRLFKDVDTTKYFIEGKFKDGWAKRELLFTDADETLKDEVINTSETENYVRKDGSISFTDKVGGVDPTISSHLATKSYVDTTAGTEKFVSAGSFDETNGNLTLTVTGGSNVGVNIDDRYVLTALKHGTGAGDIVKNITTGTMNYKSIKPGGSITVANNTDDITIAGGGLTTVALGSDVTGILPIGNGGTGGDDAAEARNNLGVDPLGTDNSTDVTLAGTPDYVTIGSGADKQKLTLGAIVLTTDVSGNLPDGNIASSATWNGMLDSVLAIGGVGSVDIVSDSNDYTSGAGGTAQLRKLKGTGSITVAIDGSDGHINIGGGGLTSVALASNVTGVLPIANGGTNSTTAANALAALGAAALGHNHSGTYDNYSSWTAKDHDGTVYTVTSGDTLWIKEGTGIDVNFTADDELTITNTAPDVDHQHWDGSDTGLDHSAGRSSLQLGTASQSNTGDFAAAAHNQSASTITSGTLAVGRGGTGVTSYAELKTALTLGNAAYADLGTANSDAARGDHTHTSFGTTTFTADIKVADNIWINAYTDDTNNRIRLHHNASNAYHDWEGGYYYMRYDTTSKFRFNSSGQLDCAADVIAYSSSASDMRLKDNIEPMERNLDKLAMLTPISFEYKEKRDGKHLGLSAQEVEKVFPNIVKEIDMMSFGKDGEEFKTIRQQELIPVLIGAIKELKDELDELKCR